MPSVTALAAHFLAACRSLGRDDAFDLSAVMADDAVSLGALVGHRARAADRRPALAHAREE